MLEMLPEWLQPLAMVLFIDVVLAGDNAIVVGMAAAGLPADQRKKAIFWGIIAATVMRIAFASVTVQLLQIVGIVLAGGVLLLWVCWKMYRELRDGGGHGDPNITEQHEGVEALENGAVPGAPKKTLRQAITQILVADVSMSLDNVLAVAGAAREHPSVLVIGLALLTQPIWTLTTPVNGTGAKLKGVEVGGAHAFTYLPGVLRHLGVTGNFTYIDEKSDLRDQEGDPIGRRGLSKYTWNASAYYDDKKVNLRLAYNWRSDFTRREVVQLGFGRPEALPEIEAARGQLDFAARFIVNRNLRITADATNLTNTGTFRYLKYEQLVNYVSLAGRRFNLGVQVTF